MKKLPLLMKMQNKIKNNVKTQERLSEIAAIIARGIYRLEEKKSIKKDQIPLDSKSFLSVHSVGLEHVQQPTLL